MKIFKRICIIISVLLFSVTAAFLIYVNQYYRALPSAIEAYQNHENVTQVDNMTIFYPSKNSDNHNVILFYPGGKVEALAYAPLLTKLADEGYTTILFEMPFNLAVFGIDSAKNAFELVDAVESYHLMGHSLGGAMASSYVESNSNIDSLILLGAYPINELTIPIISIYGENDLVVNRDKLATVSNKVEISGGNHAFFGNYGLQNGDGQPTISEDEQQNMTVIIIDDFINNINTK